MCYGNRDDPSMPFLVTVQGAIQKTVEIPGLRSRPATDQNPSLYQQTQYRSSFQPAPESSARLNSDQ